MIILNGTVYPDLKTSPISELNSILQNANPFEETVRVEAGKIIFFEAHYFRMMASMRILRMGIPMTYTLEYFEEQTSLLLQETGLQNTSALLCFSFFSTSIPSRSNPIAPTSFVLRASATESPIALQTMNHSIDLYKDHWVVKGLISTLEPSNDRMRKLASIYAYENDFEDCVLLNHEKQITETITGSIFLVKGNQIKTPPLSSGCRSSVYRQVVIDIILKENDFELTQEEVSPFELQKADEVFIVSVTHGIQSVKQYRKKTFTSTAAEHFFSKFILSYRLS